MTIRRMGVAITCVLGVSASVTRMAAAQTRSSQTTPKKAAATGCGTVDTTAAWYKRQWATLDETNLKWSNDSLRTVLLDAAGLTVATALVPQLGWQNADAPLVITPAESTVVAALKRRGGRGRGAGGRGAAPPAAGATAGGAGTTSGGAGSVAAGAGATTAGSTAVAAGTGARAGGGGRGGGAPWPTKSVVGAAGVRAVFVIMQSDSALQESGMHQLMEPGPDEDIAADIAILNDRTRLRAGRKQPFGTQLHMVGGKLIPLPIEDSAHVDLRRDDAGLPPLVWSVCNANAKK
ncbi:MAG TPA: DUF6624 domain-containing protein [Gemmatimonadaceae bacterium]|nr:DUF6624 domain-containing protein [Gemmatimonadaceae bacterium]